MFIKYFPDNFGRKTSTCPTQNHNTYLSLIVHMNNSYLCSFSHHVSPRNTHAHMHTHKEIWGLKEKKKVAVKLSNMCSDKSRPDTVYKGSKNSRRKKNQEVFKAGMTAQASCHLNHCSYQHITNPQMHPALW